MTELNIDITIGDVLELIDTLDSELREELLKRLLELLTSYSHKAILQYQLDWDGSTSLEEFIAGQNKVIRECIIAEISPFGRIVRSLSKVDPLDLESMIFHR